MPYAALLLVLSSLVCGGARAQPVPPPAPTALPALVAGDPGRATRAAALGGVIVAGLLLSGTLAIELLDHIESEKITRGVHLGFTAVTAPLVALSVYALRRRAPSGADALRAMGWTFYIGAVAFGVGQWYDALHERGTPIGFGFLYGALSVLSILPHCFDAYLTARSARLPILLAPTGVFGRF